MHFLRKSKSRLKLYVTLSLALTSSMAFALDPKPQNESASAVKVASDKVPVELEWEEIPEAKMYELEFQSLEGAALATFKSATHIFKFHMKVGKYKVRSRVADARRAFGEWSALTEFSVQPKAPFFNPETAVRTVGKIDPKTLRSVVIVHWGRAEGARRFKLTILDTNGNVAYEEITDKYFAKAELPVGEYKILLSAVGVDEVASESVVIKDKVVIESVRLRPPEIIFEGGQNLFAKDGVPLVRWKPRLRSFVNGTLEYRFFFGEEWIPAQKFSSDKVQEKLLDKAVKPGRYRLTLWSEAKGLMSSEPVVYEFVIKPKAYEPNP